MGRRGLAIRTLAREAGCDSDTVLLTLWEHNLQVPETRHRLRVQQIDKAREALELSGRKEATRVARLADRYNVPVEAAYRELKTCGVLRTRREFVPRSRKKEAERILKGLRKQIENISVGKMLTDERVSRPHQISQNRVEVIWRVVGKMEQVVYLNENQIVRIHEELVKDLEKTDYAIRPSGVADKSLLGSAVFRQYTAIGRELKYPTVSMAAAALFTAIVQNHAFYNGNKRTALVSLLVFLDQNEYLLDGVCEEDLFQYVVQVASHTLIAEELISKVSDRDLFDLELLEVAEWLHSHIRRIEKAERLVRFHDLTTILKRYNCEFSTLSGSRIKITRGTHSTHIIWAGEGSELDKGSVHKIRKALGLDDDNGYDSFIFYNAEAGLTGFIKKYRKVLARLAHA